MTKTTCPTCGGKVIRQYDNPCEIGVCPSHCKGIHYKALSQPDLTKLGEALDRFDSSIEPAEDKWPILYIAIEDFLNELEETKL